jgi:hypothetical protein
MEKWIARPESGSELAATSYLAGHPTPSSEGSAGEISEDLERVGGKFRNRKTGRILQTNLATDTLMLCGHPTCSARDWKDTPGMAQTGTNPDGTERSRLDMLPRVAALAGYYTPRACDGDHPPMGPRGCGLGQDVALASPGPTPSSTATSTAKTAAYRLNPGFSLWLMIGIPTIVDEWASCGVRAMQSCRRSPKNSSKRGKK